MRQLTPYEIGYLAALIDRCGTFFIRYRNKKNKVGGYTSYWNSGLTFNSGDKFMHFNEKIISLIPNFSGTLCKKNNTTVPASVIIKNNKTSVLSRKYISSLSIQGSSLDKLIDLIYEHLIFKKKQCEIIRLFRSTVLDVNGEKYSKSHPIPEEVRVYRQQLIHDLYILKKTKQ